MKRKSLKVKITLWYATFMLVLAAAFAGLITIIVSQKTDDNIRESLIRTVEIVASKVTNQKTINFEELLQKDIDSYMIGIYGSNGELMAGTQPRKVEEDLAFSDTQLRSQIIQYQVYYVYDIKVITGNDYVWVRGYMRTMSAADTLYTIKHATLIGLPILVLLMLIGGYILTNRALKPLNWMVEEADAINGGDDLNRRVEVPDTQDEIYHLGSTINQMLVRLQSSFQREKQFTSDASHELRTPISIILAQCELVEEDATVQEECRQAFEVISRQANKMKLLVEDLLQLSRMEAYHINSAFLLLNVTEMVIGLVEEQKLLHEDNTTYVMDMKEEITVMGDEKLLTRAVTNLLNNAYQYGNGWIRVTLKVQNSAVVISVEDNGQGIQKDNITKIWDRFYQEESSRTYKGGFGLGLPMVKSIAELHGGAVFVQSRLGEGSIFTIKIPQRN